MNKLFKCILLLVLIAAFLASPAIAGQKDRFSTIELVDIPNATSGTDIVTKTATQSLTNKSLIIPFTTFSPSDTGLVTYSVAAADGSPGVYWITTGSGATALTMTYTGAAATNKGKLFYIINSSSNSVVFKQTDATGVTIATLKIVTVVGNGTDFVRITADQ